MLLIAVLAACSVALSAQPKSKDGSSPVQGFVYRLQPSPKDTYLYQTTVEIQQVLHVMGMDQTVRSDVDAKQECIVASIDTVIRLRLRQRDVTIKIRGVESLGVEDSMLTVPEIEHIVLEHEYTPSGKMLIQRIVRDSLAGGAESMVRMQMFEQFTGGGIRMPLLQEFPLGMLTRGQQWTTTRTDTAVLDLANQRVVTTMELRHTFEGFMDTLGRQCAVVRTESTRYLFSGTTEQMGNEMSITGDGTLTMRSLVEIRTGMPLLIETTAQIDQRIILYEQGQTVIPISVDIRGRVARLLR